MSHTIFMITGLSDVEIAGNQSLKNSLTFLSKSDFHIHLFSFLPSNYPNLEKPGSLFLPNVTFHRLPAIFSPLVALGKLFKDLFGKRKSNKFSVEIMSNNMAGTFLREYNPLGRITYILFLFLFYTPLEFLRIILFCLKHNPDLFYGVNCQGSFLASLLGRTLHKPIITRFHGISVTLDDLNNWKRKIFLLDEITGLTAKTDAIIVTNDGTKGEDILKRLKVNGNKIRFWLNGFDYNHLSLPPNWDRKKFIDQLGIANHFVLLMVSRLASWKRVDRGIDIVNRLVQKHNFENQILLIAGEGPERKKLENLVVTLNLKRYVRFLGGIPHREIAKYYSCADAFLSLYDVSNLGNPIFEALFFGLPLITINDGSTHPLLQNDYNSILVNPANITEEAAEKIHDLSEHAELRERLHNNAQSTFAQNILSWQDRMKLEEDLIKTLLKN